MKASGPHAERGDAARLLVSCFSQPTTRSSLPRLAARPGAGQDAQVTRDDAEPDPALHAVTPMITASAETVSAFDHADPSLAPRTPAQRAPIPARRGRSSGRRPPAPWQRDARDPEAGRRAFLGRRPGTRIPPGQAGW